MNHHESIAMSHSKFLAEIYPQTFNDYYRENKKSYGDDGTIVRKVLHFVGPEINDPMAASLDHATSVLEELGFRANEIYDGSGLVLLHWTEIASVDFDQLTDELKTCIHQLGWKYGTWECNTTTPDMLH